MILEIDKHIGSLLEFVAHGSFDEFYIGSNHPRRGMTSEDGTPMGIGGEASKEGLKSHEEISKPIFKIITSSEDVQSKCVEGIQLLVTEEIEVNFVWLL